jgi:1-deoxy-D-xylulose-5-phosphate reductoisomerase
VPAVLNAANEEAVAAFLAGAIPFTAIADLVAETMDAHRPVDLTSLETVLEADAWAREACRAAFGRHAASRAAS